MALHCTSDTHCIKALSCGQTTASLLGIQGKSSRLTSEMWLTSHGMLRTSDVVVGWGPYGGC